MSLHSIAAVRRRLPRLAAAGLLASALVATTGLGALAAGSSHPSWMTPLGTRLLFVADGGTGYELWATDGTATTLVKEVGPGAESSNAHNLVRAGTKVFFSAWDGTADSLWRTDGTGPGTKRLATLVHFDPGVAVGGRIYLAGSTGTDGFELWTSDGTIAGTKRLTDLQAGSADGIKPYGMAPIGSRVAFVGNGADGSEDLWTSGPTPGSAKRIKDFTGHDTIDWIYNVAGTLIFQHSLYDGGAELWSSDGTRTGTKRFWSTSRFADTPTVAGSTLFFRTSTDAAGLELWKTKGTAASTRMVKDINPGSADGYPDALTAVGSKVFFRASTDDYDLWVSDGTRTGTKNLDINPAGDAFPNNLQAVGDRLYLYAVDASHGREPWRSDGTPAGTKMIEDVRPGDGDSSSFGVRPFGKLGTRVYFAADDGTHGDELWRTTSGGAKLWANISAD